MQRPIELLLVIARTYLSLAGLVVVGAVHSENSGNFDGPAELPRVYIRSSLSDTPSPGKTRTVAGGSNLQQAINSASCGDTLLLQAGATFSGKLILPAKNCDDSHWITVRTSARDSVLPPEGKRLTPCYAGVSFLPGRPDLHCVSAQNLLAKLEFSAKGGSGPLVFASGANHYRLIGLEVTRSAPGADIYSLISLEPSAKVGARLQVMAHWWASAIEASLDENSSSFNYWKCKEAGLWFWPLTVGLLRGDAKSPY